MGRGERGEEGTPDWTKGGSGEPPAEREERANDQPEGVECEPLRKESDGKQPKGEDEANHH